MAKNPRKYSFLIKYSIGYMPMDDDDDGDLIAECLPSLISRGDGFPIEFNDYDIRNSNQGQILEVRSK